MGYSNTSGEALALASQMKRSIGGRNEPPCRSNWNKGSRVCDRYWIVTTCRLTIQRAISEIGCIEAPRGRLESSSPLLPPPLESQTRIIRVTVRVVASLTHCALDGRSEGLDGLTRSLTDIGCLELPRVAIIEFIVHSLFGPERIGPWHSFAGPSSDQFMQTAASRCWLFRLAVPNSGRLLLAAAAGRCNATTDEGRT